MTRRDALRCLSVGAGLAGAPVLWLAARVPAADLTEAPAAQRRGKKVIAHQWFMDRWAPVCERESFRLGQLAKFMPNILQPAGRIHFVGAYADDLNWGMEAATHSANRVGQAIHHT